MSKGVKHVQVMKQKYALNKRDILSAIGFTEEDYHEFQLNQAIAFIKMKTFNDEDLVNIILSDPEFKPWWLNQWNMCDDAFVSEYYLHLSSDHGFSDFLKWSWMGWHQQNSRILSPPEEIFSRGFKTILNTIKTDSIHGTTKHKK